MADLTIDPAGIRLLVLDAQHGRREQTVATLSQAGYDDIATIDEVLELQPNPATDLALVALDDCAADTVRALRAALASDTPVLGITADPTPEGRRRAAELGVTDFILSPLEISELQMRAAATLTNSRLRRLLADRSTRLTEALRDRTAELSTVRESLSLLAAVADFHDDDSNQHAQRVGAIASAIAVELGLPESFVTMLGEAAALHDIGKVGISRRILLKPGKLSEPEWLHMMQHVDIGGQILGGAQSPVLVLAGEIARTHHEHWDGNGYTAGLRGEQIPMSGRLVAVADVWDTLTHDRPYRQAWSPDRAFAEIQQQAGSHFDPTVVEAFSALDLDALSLPGDDDRRAA